jgi:Dolichyl-phosphate-mannose-protein mannosyltransferase
LTIYKGSQRDSASLLRIVESERIRLTFVLCVAALARIWGVTFGLPNSDARPDEVTLIQVALGLLFGGLNPHFFHWPSLEFYALAALYRVAFEVGRLRGSFTLKFDVFRDAMANPGPYLLVPRALSIAAGVWTVWLVYRLTRRLFDDETGIVAAFFLAVAFLHVRESHFGMTDVPMTCLVVAALLLLSPAFEDPAQIRPWMAGGLMVGLAASTKYNAGVLLAVGFVVAAIGGAGEGGRRSPTTIARGLVAFCGAALLAFIAATPFSIIDYQAFFDGLRFDSQHLSEGHGVVLGRGWFYHLSFSLRYGLGTPLLMASVAGMPILAVRAWRKAAVLCAFPILYYLILGRGYTVFVRYMIPIVPFLCVTAAVTIVEITRLLARQWPRAGQLIVTTLAILVALPSIGRVIAFDRLIARPDTRVLAATWLDARTALSDWIAEAPSAFLHPLWGRSSTLQLARFDATRGLFVSDQNEAVMPAWVVVAKSPLSVYTARPDGLMPLVQSKYSLAASFPAATGSEPPAWFDQQDKFFMPFVAFVRRLGPGPDIEIYRRRLD